MEVSVFVGIQIERKKSGSIVLKQTGLIEATLKKFKMQDCKPSSVPLQPNEEIKPAKTPEAHLPYREIIGSLLFLARTTRPDIAFAIARLSQFTSCYDETHWRLAKTVLRYLKKTSDLGLEYKAGNEVTLSGFTDSDYAGDRIERKSTTGFAFFLNNSLISWCSQKQQMIALSSTEAEYVALAQGAKEAIWMRRFAEELGFAQNEPTQIYVDNQSAIKLAHNSEFHNRSKHIDVRYHFTRGLIENKEIQVSYVPTTEQKADILTKPLLRGKHEEMREMIGMVKDSEEPKHTTSSRGSMSLLTYGLVVLLCLSIAQVSTTSTQTSQPVLWRLSKTPVTTGHNRVYLRIRLMNPCSIMTNEILHSDVASMAKTHCEELYQSYFLDEMRKMCPEKNQREVLIRSKRFISLLVGIIIATIITSVAIGTAGVVVAATNSNKIRDLKEVVGEQAKQLKELEKRVDLVENSVKNLRRDFKLMIEELKRQEMDFSELKQKQVGSNFAISYVTTRLIMVKHIIQEANRQWKQGKVYAPLLDYLNFTLPCGDECPVSLAIARKCYLTDDQEDLYIDFDNPLVNNTLQLLEADPFELMQRVKNKTCRIKYTGPENVILSTANDCVYTINVKSPVTHNLILAPSQGCKPHTGLPAESKYFGMGRCENQHPFDEWDFIQVKPHHGFNHVYCPNSTLTIDNKTQTCPDGVFLLPMGASFKINSLEYKGSQVHLDHQETVDPLFTMRTNWHLLPTLYLDRLMEDIQSEDAVHKQTKESHSNPVVWTMIVCTCIIAILTAVVVTTLLLRKKSFRVSVTAQPVSHQHNPEIIEMTTQD